MQISTRVHLLASGRLGCSVSHPNDCNVYAVSCGPRYFLIDTGVGLDTGHVTSELATSGIDNSRIAAILLTHGHLDHSGGARALSDCLRVPVFASKQTAAALETADENAISLAAAKRAGIYPSGFAFQACPVARVFEERESFTEGDCRITAIPTPGHSGDMLSYFFETPEGSLLFPGDTVFHGGKILLSSTWDCSPESYVASLQLLSSLNADALYPGHGIWSVRDAARHLDSTRRYTDQLLLPPNLL